MSVPAAAFRIRRILVALDATARCAAALEESARFAARLDAELLGVFVEDVNLLRLAALPFVRETGTHSATTRRIEDRAMERALRVQAQQARAALDAAAARMGVAVRFAVARGQVAAQLIEAARDADLVILALARREAIGAKIRAVLSGVPGPLLLLREGAGVRAPVVTVHDGTPTADRAVEIAGQLAHDLGARELTVLTPVPGSGGGERLRRELPERLRHAGLAAHIHPVPDGVEALVRAILRLEPGTLVLTAGCEPLLPALLAGDGSAILLLR